MKIHLPGARTCVLATLLAATSGCAYSYHTINPKQVAYGNEQTHNGVAMSYHYNVLSEANNKRYGNKEQKNGLSVVAVKLTNTTDSAITISPTNIRLSSGGQGLSMVPPAIAANQLNQTVWPHVFWLLLNVQLFEQDQYGNKRTIAFIPVGAPIALINMLTGSHANRKLRENFQANALTARRLEPGETVYGLITLRDMGGYNPIRFELATPESAPR